MKNEICMNEIINNFSLAGDKLIHEMHFKIHCIYTVFLHYLLKSKKQYRNSNEEEIQDMFIKKSYIKFAFKMILAMEILKIGLEEKLIIN